MRRRAGSETQAPSVAHPAPPRVLLGGENSIYPLSGRRSQVGQEVEERRAWWWALLRLAGFHQGRRRVAAEVWCCVSLTLENGGSSRKQGEWFSI